ncbi:MAG TPA: hypothetical protein VKM69_01510, partial [Natronoarchaeum rubrum]|nr:hypothetical protein [Natronoarchaeum rubrum]
AYLWTLREDLTGYYGETRPANGDEHPRPAGDVRVVEYAEPSGDDETWTVTLQWDADEESLDRVPSDDRVPAGGSGRSDDRVPPAD